MTPAEEQQLAHAAKTNAPLRKLIDERARLRAALIEMCDVVESDGNGTRRARAVELRTLAP